MRLALAVIAMMFAAGLAIAADRPDSQIEAWYEASDACANGPQSVHNVACAKRTALQAALKAAGWCYGVPTGFTMDERWRSCTP
jgi:hypothetical protein